MAITYPLALPALSFVGLQVRMRDVVGAGQSPFTLSEQFQSHAGQRWEADVSYPPMIDVSIIEAVSVFLASLKGRTGTFLMPVDPLRLTPRGTWAGSPQVAGTILAGSSVLTLDGLTVGATIKAGDFVQVGTGSSSHVHKVMADVTANGSGQATLDIWPNIRLTLADNSAIVINSPKGVWRLATNQRSFDITGGRVYGMSFSAVEAL